MKKDTINIHTQIANDIMYYIYRYIDTDINLDELSSELKISKFHMHRVFKAEFGHNIYESIKSIRLQKAASLLLTNYHSTITQIASMCGYSAQGSFIRAFKAKFFQTPKEWRAGGYKQYSQKILNTSLYAQNRRDFSSLTPKIVKLESFQAYYIRHQGYNRSIKQTWQKLQTWLLCNDITQYEQIGLHHDNPTITKLDECRYIAAVATSKKVDSATLPSFEIPSGVYAQFDFSGAYGDVLSFMHWVYFEWLIKSGYETTTNPSFAKYYKNHFLSDDEKFDLSYFIPIRL